MQNWSPADFRYKIRNSVKCTRKGNRLFNLLTLFIVLTLVVKLKDYINSRKKSVCLGMKCYTYLSVFSISVETCHRCCWISVGDNDVSSKIGTSELSSTLVSKILGGPQGSFPLKYLNKTCIPIIYWLKWILKLSNSCFELDLAQHKWRKRLLKCKLWVRTVQKQSRPQQATNLSAAIYYSYQFEGGSIKLH